MIKTKIEWSDSTWSPVTGCYHPCPYCYARSTANRFKGCDCAAGGETDENVVYLKERLTVTSKDGVVRNAAYPFGFTPTFHEYRLNDPLTKGFGKTIFVCSMADLFGDWVPDEWIKKVFDACKAASGHRYLFLTKNPARYIRLYEAGLLPAGDEFWYPDIIKAFRMFWDRPLYYKEDPAEPATMIFDTGEMDGTVDTTPLFTTPLLRAAGVTLKLYARTKTEMETAKLYILSSLGFAVTETLLPVLERDIDYRAHVYVRGGYCECGRLRERRHGTGGVHKRKRCVR